MIYNTTPVRMTEEDTRSLQERLRALGAVSGTDAGAVAGREAGARISLDILTRDVITTARKAAEQAAAMAKAEGDKAQEEELRRIAAAVATEAAVLAGEEACVKAAEAGLEQFILDNFDHIAKEAGAQRGAEIFSEFGARVGEESGLIAGRKAVLERALEMIKEPAKAMGATAAMKQVENHVQTHIIKENWAMLTEDKVNKIKQKYKEIGASVGITTGKNIATSVLDGLDKSTLAEVARKAASEAGEKYAVKAKEFQKLGMKIAEDAGGQAGDEAGEEEGGEAGEREGGQAGERTGREAGAKVTIIMIVMKNRLD